jgi:hypothetical protein
MTVESTRVPGTSYYAESSFVQHGAVFNMQELCSVLSFRPTRWANDIERERERERPKKDGRKKIYDILSSGPFSKSYAVNDDGLQRVANPKHG